MGTQKYTIVQTDDNSFNLPTNLKDFFILNIIDELFSKVSLFGGSEVAKWLIFQMEA